MTRTLEVAIGLGGTYLFLSIIVLALNEGIAGFFNRRGVMLKEALEAMLSGELAKKLVAHPLVTTLAQAGHKREKVKFPSYLGAATFSQAMTEVIAGTRQAKQQISATYSAFVGALPSDEQARLKKIVGDGVDTVEELQQRLEGWFNSSMERLSGAYKRRTQMFSRLLAAALVLGLNVNTITMAEALWMDPELRAAGVKKAQSLYQRCGEEEKLQPDVQPQPQPVGQGGACPDLKSLTAEEIPFPISGRVYDTLFTSPLAFVVTVFGLLLTIWAVSLGAPFWFDTLRKLSGGIQQTGPRPK